MASHDEYYSNKPLPQPTYSPYTGQSSSSYDSPVPPPYSFQSQHPAAGHPPGGHPGQSTSPLSAPSPSTSPFDTPFDDHVYPAGSRNTPSSSANQLNDIPLQDRAQKDLDAEDHVYDASRRGRRRKGGVRVGELGMLGSKSKRIPWVVYLFTVAQVAVFIGEIVKNATSTGSPIMIKPSFNPMIGPSPYVMINMGARFVPCMRNIQGVQTSTQNISWPCPNTTTNDVNSPELQCTLSKLCGFGGVPEYYNVDIDHNPEPNQWFRFIVPMFMHAGLIHIGFNLLLQLTMGREMEKAIGPIRFFLVYASSGIFGFVMGGNFAAPFISSTGASGCLFGVIALTLLDLLYSWKDRRSPVKDLMFILLDVVISFVLGLLPGLDNFSHIGGFLMGLALGICVLHSPNSLRQRIGDDPSYASVGTNPAPATTPQAFVKNPIGFFSGRKPLWWAWWLIRVGALVLVLIVFILLLKNFYVWRRTCGWCKYLSCLPVKGWCDIGNLSLKNTSTSSSNKRDLLLGVARLHF